MIVGLSGYAQTGKDTVAAILVEKHGFERVAFADKLREFLLRVNPMVLDSMLAGWPPKRMRDVVVLDNWDAAKKKSEVRQLLQATGMAARDLLGEDVWVHALFGPFDRAVCCADFHDDMTPRRLVIPDVRFPNELAAIRERGGVVWRVERPGVGPVNGHPSETAIDLEDFDHVIDNRNNVEWLRSYVADLMKGRH